MTDRGFAAIEAAAPGHVEAVRRNVFDVLTDEQVRQLGEISAAIRDGLLLDGAEAGGPGHRRPQSEAEASPPCQ
jgi:hypothetical protein